MIRDPLVLFRTIESIFQIKDLDTLLERVLLEARRFTRADAGAIYLIGKEKESNEAKGEASTDSFQLSFVQNDTLFKDETKDKYLRSGLALPIDNHSIAGYVAMTGEALLIEDVRDLPEGLCYSADPSFDLHSSYRTVSQLVVPLRRRDGVVIGVLQLINAKDERGKVEPFSMQDRIFISQFALNASDAIEKARLSRQMVLRMVELAELRDPNETPPHLKRVGAYSAELYEFWAARHGVPPSELSSTRDILKTAAILHDVGMMTVSDAILKKTCTLSHEEKLQLRYHTILGARLFSPAKSPWDTMAQAVALRHHENWDGSGYPGKIEDLFAEDIQMGPGMQGTEIPLSARIVAVADVFDALTSERPYRPQWKQNDALRYIRYQAGKKFDPELVGLFINMAVLLAAVRNKYR